MISERLKEARLAFNYRFYGDSRKNKLSQREAESRSNLPKGVISQFETGARGPTIESLRRLSKGLRVSTDYLLGETDSMGKTSGRKASIFLTDGEEKVFDALGAFIKEHKMSPTTRELAEKLKMTPPSVHQFIKKMSYKGYLEHTPRKPRSIFIRKGKNE